jgi:hypothetical protein
MAPSKACVMSGGARIAPERCNTCRNSRGCSCCASSTSARRMKWKKRKPWACGTRHRFRSLTAGAIVPAQTGRNPRGGAGSAQGSSGTGDGGHTGRPGLGKTSQLLPGDLSRQGGAVTSRRGCRVTIAVPQRVELTRLKTMRLVGWLSRKAAGILRDGGTMVELTRKGNWPERNDS